MFFLFFHLNSLPTLLTQQEIGPHTCGVGEQERGSDGLLTRLEAIFEQGDIVVEVYSAIEKDTGNEYGIDLFKNGKYFDSSRMTSIVQFPPIRERKFGPDHQDWKNIQRYVNAAMRYHNLPEFHLNDDLHPYHYMSTNEWFTDIMIVDTRLVENKN